MKWKCLLVFLVMPCVAAGQVTTIQQFVAQKDKWPTMAKTEQPIRLLGRFATKSGKLLRLKKCDLLFRAGNTVHVPRLRGNRTIEVFGHLTTGTNGVEFAVERIIDNGSDTEGLKLRRERLGARDPVSKWYDLAAEARKTAEFYDDAELLAECRRTVLVGFATERARVKTKDFETLRKLADKARNLSLPKSERMGMIHKSLRWRWDALQKTPDADVPAFLKLVANELPNAKTAIRLPDEQLRRRYEEAPIKVYDQSPESTRFRLHRYFYRQVLKPEILAQANADGSNGREIAGKLRKQIPEEKVLAGEWESRDLEFRFRNVESAPRSELLTLADELEQVDEKKRALEAKTRWVRAAEKRLAGRGPAALVQLAAEYDSLLGDTEQAVRLLKTAWKQSTEKSEIEDKLKRYGQFRRHNRWMTAAEVESLPQNQLETAMREGRVIRGMTPAQVRKTMGGDPNSIVRFASARSAQMIWLFGERGTNRISVLFVKRATAATVKPVVLRVSTVPAD